MNTIYKLLAFCSVFLVCFVAVAQDERQSLSDTLLQLSTEVENDEDKLLERVRYLEENGEYDASRCILTEKLQNGFSKKLVEYWLQADSKFLSSIEVQRNSSSEFKHIEITWGGETSWDILKMSKSLGNSPYLSIIYFITTQEKKRIEKMKQLDFNLLAPEQIKTKISQFDFLKKSVHTIEKIIDNELIKSDREHLPTIVKYSKQIEKLKTEIKKKRTDFVSYDVISPYLADATRWLIVSKGKWYLLIFEDKEAFKIAIKNLTQSCHQNLLMESHEDVRIQFFEVQKQLKSAVGKDEFEELKVLTTLMDSNDPNKKHGADAWWE